MIWKCSWETASSAWSICAAENATMKWRGGGVSRRTLRSGDPVLQPRQPSRPPETVAKKANEEVRKLEAAVAALGGENSVHAKPPSSELAWIWASSHTVDSTTVGGRSGNADESATVDGTLHTTLGITWRPSTKRPKGSSSEESNIVNSNSRLERRSSATFSRRGRTRDCGPGFDASPTRTVPCIVQTWFPNVDGHTRLESNIVASHPLNLSKMFQS